MEARTVRRAVAERFAAADPELPNGFAEHAPMGVDALLSLGLDPATVLQWADRHQPVAIDPAGPIATRRDVLLAELTPGSWPDVVRREVAALAPHVGAHLFHGLIRTAHAVRGLLDEPADAPDPAVVGEVATALAAWHVWAARERERDDAAATAAVGDARSAILDAARRGAGACARQPSIVHLHAVTGPLAFLLLAELRADLVDEDAIVRAAGAFGRTHARYQPPQVSDRTVPPGPSVFGSLLERWDAHPAKLTEAALRGFAATGDGVFLEAIEAIMGPWPAATPPAPTP